MIQSDRAKILMICAPTLKNGIALMSSKDLTLELTSWQNLKICYYSFSTSINKTINKLKVQKTGCGSGLRTVAIPLYGLPQDGCSARQPRIGCSAPLHIRNRMVAVPPFKATLRFVALPPSKAYLRMVAVAASEMGTSGGNSRLSFQFITFL